MTNNSKLTPNKKFEKQIDESNFGCLGKTPNGKRLADHYPWNYKIVDCDVTQAKSILLTNNDLLAGLASTCLNGYFQCLGSKDLLF